MGVIFKGLVKGYTWSLELWLIYDLHGGLVSLDLTYSGLFGALGNI